MLSARGALTVPALINELFSSCSCKGLVITETARVWEATFAAVRSQLLLGCSVTLGKYCSFWCRQNHVATDGNSKYFVRQVCFGFTPSFCTVYGLDSLVPREDAKLKFSKLPLDIVALQAKVPAEVVLSTLQEMFLYIGEGLFNGKVFHLRLPGLLTVLVKREKCSVTVDSALERDLFNIDCRKWPLAVKEVAAMKFSTASTAVVPIIKPSTPRPVSAIKRAPSQQRAFVAAARRGQLFCEMEVRPQLVKRPVAVPLKKRHHPLKPKYVDPTAEEDESVYDLVPPNHVMEEVVEPTAHPITSFDEPTEQKAIQLDGTRLSQSRPPVEVSANLPPQPSLPQPKQFLPWVLQQDECPAEPSKGRRRFSNKQFDGVSSLLHDNWSS